MEAQNKMHLHSSVSPKHDDTLLARLNSKDGKHSITSYPLSEAKLDGKTELNKQEFGKTELTS